ncbi:hypothetical protein Calab_1962 [Caldithrix abyssi DSM 13497]|uniref:Uncharacterized protein n=1 Tax=Caldithrix abyssi DSM 13497 TaxID=880073 RepID=H1XU86_CALAY|nr:hypothetical protein [Caldithrix abyssi]EHO41576.1 hypothetical protein Calab_1962 [Caldithrix abyssi DSM 13497]
MLIVSVLVAIIWGIFALYGSKESLTGTGNVRRLWYLLFYLLSGIVCLFLLQWQKSLFSIALGGFILLTGLHFLSIMEFRVLQKLINRAKHETENWIEGFPLYLVWLMYLAESKNNFTEKNLILSLFILFMAGFLQALFKLRRRMSILKWQNELTVTLTGMFLIINGLIAISGNVSFFLVIFEKILRIL